MKAIEWNKKAKELVRSLDAYTKREIGTLLMMLQQGAKLGEPQSKPMRSIHKSAYEIRVKDRKEQHRIIYILNIEEKILIPHAFSKKTQKTPKKEIETSIRRLKEMIDENK